MDCSPYIRTIVPLADELASTADPQQASTTAHLIVRLLEDCAFSKSQIVGALAKTTRRFILPKLRPRGGPPSSNSERRTYEIDALCNAVSRRDVPPEVAPGNFVLSWLLQRDSDEWNEEKTVLLKQRAVDESLEFVRQLFLDGKRNGELFLRTSRNAAIPEIGLGRWLDVSQGAPLPEILGRASDLTRHVGALSFAISQQRLYVIVGDRGAGKGLFLLHLLRKAAASLGDIRFILFGSDDYQQSAELLETGLQKLSELLVRSNDVIPVFDEWQVIATSDRLHEIFDENLGLLFRGNRRTMIACGTPEAHRRSSLISAVRPSTLSSLGIDPTLELLRKKLPQSVLDLSPHSDGMIEGGVNAFAEHILLQCQERYPKAALPGQALELLDGALVQSRIRGQNVAKPSPALLRQDVWEHVALDLGLNPETAGRNKQDFYLTLRRNLKKDLFGQDHVINQVCNVLFAKAHSPPRELPRGRFLFAGPPGTGKTLLGKSLARRLGYGPDAYHEFNMSEYSGEGARNRFIGSDPGYRDFGETFTIFHAVRQTPACVILLDEIDRADRTIQDLLLGFLEGRGRDASGNAYAFHQVIFILTTNQGQEMIERYCQANTRDNREHVSRDFNSERLRQLLLKRAASETELGMRSVLTDEMDRIRKEFEAAGDVLAGDAAVSLIDRYVSLQRADEVIAYDNGKPILDRALLDRIDFIFPFFPLERPQVEQILRTKLAEAGVNVSEIPAPDLQKLTDEAVEEQGTGRGAGRVVERYVSSRYHLGEDDSPQSTRLSGDHDIPGNL